MLSHWLIVVPKGAKADSQVTVRVDAALARFLYYNPENLFFHRHPTGVWCFSVSAGTSVWDLDPPYDIADGMFTALAGVPTFEALAQSNGESPPVSMRRALDGDGPHWVYENVGGAYSVGRLRKDGGGRAAVSAFSDFSGYHSCFYLDTPSYSVVGNRASFVGAFAADSPDVQKLDARTLSWIVGTTMVMGTATPFADVQRLRCGYRIEISKDPRGHDTSLAVSPMRPDHFSPVPGASMDDLPLADACERLGRRVRWCAEKPANLLAHLTGGRDTRAIAAVLADQGCAHLVSRFSTMGTEENGDVIIARQIAEALGVQERHRVTLGSKGDDSLSPADLASVICRSPFVFECQLTPHDGRRFALKSIPTQIVMMGGGGEIYRQEWGTSERLIEPDGARRALGLFASYDRLGLLSERAQEFQLATIRDELHHLQQRGATNVASAFYLEERLSNWGNSHFSNGPTTQFPVLLDQRLARHVLSMDGVAEHMHFELIRHCAKELLEIPFLNKQWADETERRAQGLGLSKPPLVVPPERNFPWQHDCYRRFRDALIGFCLECGDALRDWVPPEKLEKLRKTPVEPFGSAHIKVLLGLSSAIIFMEGCWNVEREFDGVRPTIGGNKGAELSAYQNEHDATDNEVRKALVRNLNRGPAQGLYRKLQQSRVAAKVRGAFHMRTDGG